MGGAEKVKSSQVKMEMGCNLQASKQASKFEPPWRLRSRLAWRQPSERRTHRERRDRCSAAPHRSVAADFGLRHLVRSRSGQPLIEVPAQPAAVLRVTRSEPMLLTWPVPPADTALHSAARALVGKSYAPSAPRAGLRTPDAEAAEGLRLAVDVGRGARGQRPARS